MIGSDWERTVHLVLYSICVSIFATLAVCDWVFRGDNVKELTFKFVYHHLCLFASLLKVIEGIDPHGTFGIFDPHAGDYISRLVFGILLCAGFIVYNFSIRLLYTLLASTLTQLVIPLLFWITVVNMLGIIVSIVWNVYTTPKGWVLLVPHLWIAFILFLFSITVIISLLLTKRLSQGSTGPKKDMVIKKVNIFLLANGVVLIAMGGIMFLQVQWGLMLFSLQDPSQAFDMGVNFNYDLVWNISQFACLLLLSWWGSAPLQNILPAFCFRKQAVGEFSLLPSNLSASTSTNVENKGQSVVPKPSDGGSLFATIDRASLDSRRATKQSRQSVPSASRSLFNFRDSRVAGEPRYTNGKRDDSFFERPKYVPREGETVEDKALAESMLLPSLISLERFPPLSPQPSISVASSSSPSSKTSRLNLALAALDTTPSKVDASSPRSMSNFDIPLSPSMESVSYGASPRSSSPGRFSLREPSFSSAQEPLPQGSYSSIPPELQHERSQIEEHVRDLIPMMPVTGDENVDDPLHTTLVLHPDAGDENKTDSVRISGMKLVSFTVRKSTPTTPRELNQQQQQQSPNFSNRGLSPRARDDVGASFSISVIPNPPSPPSPSSPLSPSPSSSASPSTNLNNLCPPSPLRKFSSSLSPVIEGIEDMDLGSPASGSGSAANPRSTKEMGSSDLSSAIRRAQRLSFSGARENSPTDQRDPPPLEHVPSFSLGRGEEESSDIDAEIVETPTSSRRLFNPFFVSNEA